MKTFPSPVFGGADQSLGYLFPTYVPTPEQYVFEYVQDVCGVPVNDPLRPQDTVEWGAVFPHDSAGPPLTFPVQFNRPPTMLVYANANRAANQGIPVVRGWPAYPGKVPMIGVALGSDATDDQSESQGGGFAGEAESLDAQGNIVATADYYAEPVYSTIVVELIHENRDERDRLHIELHRALFPLRHKLIDRTHLIKRVRVDAEKQELPIDEQPLVIYISLFTVHVYYEMLVAENVTGAGGIITGIDLTVQPVTIDPLDVALDDAATL